MNVGKAICKSRFQFRDGNSGRCIYELGHLGAHESKIMFKGKLETVYWIAG